MSLDLYLIAKADVGGPEPIEIILFDRNITHNVHPMWTKAGVEEILYDYEGHECGQYLETLRAGIKKMIDEKEDFIKLNPSNGWGDYDGALDFLTKFTEVVAIAPKAIIHISA